MLMLYVLAFIAPKPVPEPLPSPDDDVMRAYTSWLSRLNQRLSSLMSTTFGLASSEAKHDDAPYGLDSEWNPLPSPQSEWFLNYLSDWADNSYSYEVEIEHESYVDYFYDHYYNERRSYLVAPRDSPSYSYQDRTAWPKTRDPPSYEDRPSALAKSARINWEYDWYARWSKSVFFLGATPPDPYHVQPPLFPVEPTPSPVHDWWNWELEPSYSYEDDGTEWPDASILMDDRSDWSYSYEDDGLVYIHKHKNTPVTPDPSELFHQWQEHDDGSHGMSLDALVAWYLECRGTGMRVDGPQSLLYDGPMCVYMDSAPIA